MPKYNAMYARNCASRIVLLFSLLLIASCATEPEPKEQEPVKENGPDKSLTNCLDKLSSKAHVDGPEAVAACKDVWKNPACSNAWNDALAMPRGERPEHIVKSCAAAYCPLFTDVQPTLCNAPGKVDLSAQTPPWMQYWTDFSRMALASDLNMEPAPELGAFAQRLLTLVALSD